MVPRCLRGTGENCDAVCPASEPSSSESLRSSRTDGALRSSARFPSAHELEKADITNGAEQQTVGGLACLSGVQKEDALSGFEFFTWYGRVASCTSWKGGKPGVGQLADIYKVSGQVRGLSPPEAAKNWW